MIDNELYSDENEFYLDDFNNNMPDADELEQIYKQEGLIAPEKKQSSEIIEIIEPQDQSNQHKYFIEKISKLELENNELKNQLKELSLKISNLDNNIENDIHEPIQVVNKDIINDNEEKLLETLFDSEGMDYKSFKEITKPIDINSGPYLLQDDGSFTANLNYKSLNSLPDTLKLLYQNINDIKHDTQDNIKKGINPIQSAQLAAEKLDETAKNDPEHKNNQIHKCSEYFEKIEGLKVTPINYDDYKQRIDNINKEKNTLQQFSYWWLKVMDRIFDNKQVQSTYVIALTAGNASRHMIGSLAKNTYKAAKWTISGLKQGLKVNLYDSDYEKITKRKNDNKVKLLQMEGKELEKSKFAFTQYHHEYKQLLDTYEANEKKISNLNALENSFAREYVENLQIIRRAYLDEKNSPLLELLPQLNKDNVGAFKKAIFSSVMPSEDIKKGCLDFNKYLETCKDDKLCKLLSVVETVEFDNLIKNAIKNPENFNENKNIFIQYLNDTINSIVDSWNKTYPERIAAQTIVDKLSKEYYSHQANLNKLENRVNHYEKKYNKLKDEILKISSTREMQEKEKLNKQERAR